MLGRAFRQIDVEIELRCWLVFLLLGFIVAMALSLDYQWANVPHILDAGNDVFAMFVAVIHRADFGDTKVLTSTHTPGPTDAQAQTVEKGETATTV